ncbi:PI-actitoxin-Afv2a [Drosophila sulfurigaster albostrigata]|uniref:PI-actitoxin-Afv2a n=1 Tax=Drosophila sulfurigaster albostrigata TaxID=89887 RepID=UPI002D21B0B6|nr:PI-actitoxin-Afv2a [Drosophila sulfurigaster albostrigata]
MPWQWLLLLFPLLMIDGGSGASKRVKMCLQPMISGRCFGHVESYAYNPLQRRCEAFIYGGCGGNENRFDSKAECEYSCRDI